MSHALLLVPLRFPPRPRRRQAPVLQSKRDPGRPHQPPVLFNIPHPRGGCGATEGATALANVMRRLREEVPMADAAKNKVLVGLDAPDDCAVVAPGVFLFSYISL